MTASGSNARMHTAEFWCKENVEEINKRFRGRLAAAIEVDLTSRVFDCTPSPEQRKRQRISYEANFASSKTATKTVWKDGEWVIEGKPRKWYCAAKDYLSLNFHPAIEPSDEHSRSMPKTPFR